MKGGRKRAGEAGGERRAVRQKVLGVPGVPKPGTPGAKEGVKRAPRPTYWDARHTLPRLRQYLVHQEGSTCTKHQPVICTPKVGHRNNLLG